MIETRLLWDLPTKMRDQSASVDLITERLSLSGCYPAGDLTFGGWGNVYSAWPVISIQNETSLIMQIENTINSLSTRIHIEEVEPIKNYLVKYPELINFVETMSINASCEFPPPNELALEVYFDPEIDYQFLGFFIRSADYPDDFLEKVDRFRSQFDSELIERKGNLVITTDFQPPRG
jgi:hypothetical protein